MADEPTGNLDEATAWDVIEILKQEGTWVRWNRCTRDRILFGNENQEESDYMWGCPYLELLKEVRALKLRK